MTCSALIRAGFLCATVAAGSACGGVLRQPEEDASPSHDAAPIDAREDSSGKEASADGDVACDPRSGNECIRCCGDRHPEGRAILELVATSCMCASCSDACKASACVRQDGGLTLQSPCIACVKQSLASDCTLDGYLARFCGDVACASYLACIERCPD